jgi:alanine-glyoxylate transaminase/(R)-3-amino-2-methylpropionate-pyruvate transaminase
MAKGIGNGCPLAAVVTTPEVARSMVGKIHFNTFGGNPVTTAMGHAVLEVIDREGLQENARNIGQIILSGLRKLQEKHAIIGEVRGRGLMIGMELVKDRATKQAATTETATVLEIARDLGVLIGKGGLHGQTLRIAPPMCLTKADAEFLVEVLDVALSKV